MRNLMLRLPGAGRRGRRESRWRIADAGPEDRAPLAAFFEAENRRLPFGFRGELERRLCRWPGLDLADFVYATDDRGIVACVAPWSPEGAKQTVVSRLPWSLRALGRLAARLPSPPIRIPATGEPLRMPYLTHLVFAERLDAAARAAVFRALLDRLFDRWGDADWHCVAFCDFEAWGLGAALSGYVQRTVPISVYAVVAATDESAGATPLAGPPGFEMAMV
jgi:hypothetical protein